jgi:YidC/Oxa1 family membrane protein insertase
MTMNKDSFKMRLVVAAILSGLVIFLYPLFMGKTGQSPISTQTNALQNAAQEPSPQAPIPQKNITPLKTEIAPAEQPNAAQELIYSGTQLKIYCCPTGVYRKNHTSFVREEGKEYVLVDAPSAQLAPLYLKTSLGDSVAWRLEKISANTVSFIGSTQGVVIEKIWKIDESSYAITQTFTIKNENKENKNITIYLVGAGYIDSGSGMDQRFVEEDLNLDGKFYRIADAKVKKSTQEYQGYFSWAGVRNRYFSSILKSRQGIKNCTVFFLAHENDALSQIVFDISLGAGMHSTHEFLFFNGPSDYDVLKGIGMHDTITYGPFDSISKAILFVLRGIHSVLGNWGIAIILLTLLINLVLSPFTLKSIRSMAKMQKLNPQMAELRVRYKNDPHKLNAEVMELYRREKVNPFGGCLPMILQMPIFIALYQGLMKSVVLKGARFLWIKDLSMPDRFLKFNFSLPVLGEYLNLLPVVMLFAMFIQQKLSMSSAENLPEEQKQQQKIMLIVMPILFTVIFYNLPSGLVLYWLTNTIIMAVEQKVIMKKLDNQ